MEQAERENIRQRFDNIRNNVDEDVPEILLQAIKELSDLCRAHYPGNEPDVRILIANVRQIVAQKRSSTISTDDYRTQLNAVGHSVLQWVAVLEQKEPRSIVPPIPPSQVEPTRALALQPPLAVSPRGEGGQKGYREIYSPRVDVDRDGILIEAAGLTKSFGSFRLGPVNVTLKREEILGIVGVNASGKTTLLRILLGDILQDSGTIAYPAFERPGSKRHWRTIKAKMARVAQGNFAWPGQVFANLEFVASAYAKRGDDWGRDLENRLGRYELDRYQNFNWSEISGGYRTRFEIVRALLSDPDILVLDEPLAYLDVITQQAVLEDLQAIARHQNKPIGVILTSQQLYEIEAIADRLIVLEGGECKFSDTTAALAMSAQETIVEMQIVGKSLRQIEDVLKDFTIIELTPSEMGVIAKFPSGIPATTVAQTLSATCPDSLIYFRDISKSCRRLFGLVK